MCILLCIGGGLTVFYAALSLRSLSFPIVLQGLYGVFYLFLSWRLQRANRWAWWALAVLCVVSLLIEAVRLGLHGLTGVPGLVWPLLYLILLTRPTVRHWFFTPQPPPVPEIP